MVTDPGVPSARNTAALEVTRGKEERECFEIDYKTICVPKVVPPWKRDCCEPRCAEAKSVKILKTKKYECPVCQYEWKVCKPELPQVPEGGPLLDTTSRSPAYSIDPDSNLPFYGPSGSLSDQPQGIPARSVSDQIASPYLIQSQPIIPPAPPAAGSIGDYFDGTTSGEK